LTFGRAKGGWDVSEPGDRTDPIEEIRQMLRAAPFRRFNILTAEGKILSVSYILWINRSVVH
jgi:hypothetical protein